MSEFHPREQWYRVYTYTEAVHDSKGERILPPTFGPSNETMHVVHPDAYHPDPRIRVQHHAGIKTSGGIAKTACGKDVDLRHIYIEDHDPAERCTDCIAATEEAKATHIDHLQAIHDAINAQLSNIEVTDVTVELIANLEGQKARARAEIEKIKAYNGASDAIVPETPAVVDPEAVDEALHETIPNTLGELDEEESPL